MNTQALLSIERAIAALQAGKMVIMVDHENRENEGDLVIAAEKVTAEGINFMTKHARGLVCLSLQASDIERLGLPMMATRNTSRFDTAFTVSIEAASGVTTGISAADRAHTIKTAINESSGHDDIVMPGHVFPLKAKDGGVLVRAGHTEASVDITRLAGLKPASVICEIMNDEGVMAGLDDLKSFSKKHDIPIVFIDDLITYRLHTEQLVDEVASARLPLAQHGEFLIKVFSSRLDQTEHVVLIKGDLDASASPLVRIHSECLTGDGFGSLRCDCGQQLQYSLDRIGKEGGVLLYMSQEGRGIGLSNKIKAYALQDQGMDTVEANHMLGFMADLRDYGLAAQILKQLGIKQLKLLTNNPNKIKGLEKNSIEVVDRESINILVTHDNIAYLKTKRDKLGHWLDLEGIIRQSIKS